MIPVGVFSQVNVRNSVEIDENYENFRQTFDQEIGSIEENQPEETAPLQVKYSSTPAWLQDQLSFDNQSVQVIGISDPGLDSSLAMNQAIYRALFLGSLMNGSHVKNLVDYFSREKTEGGSELTGRYADYFEFSGSSPVGVSGARVIKHAYTESGECVVIVDFPLYSGSSPALTFQSNGMITEFEKNSRYECNSRIEFSDNQANNEPGESFRFIFRSINGLVEHESYSQDILLPSVIAKYKYSLSGSVSPPAGKEGTKTDRGLWDALLLSVIKEITVKIRTQSAQVQTTADNYTGNTQALDREIVTGKLTFRLDRVILQDIFLWTTLEQFNFSQP